MRQKSPASRITDRKTSWLDYDMTRSNMKEDHMFTRKEMLRFRPTPRTIFITSALVCIAYSLYATVEEPSAQGSRVSAATLKRAVVGACEEKSFVQTTSCFFEAKVPCNGKTAAECGLFSWVSGCPGEPSWAQSDCGSKKGEYNLVTQECGTHLSGMCVWAENPGGGVCGPGTTANELSCGTKDVLQNCY